MAFTDCQFEGIKISSNWKNDRITEDIETQTQDIECVESGVQHISMKNIETQTSDLIDSHKTRPLKTFNSSELTNFVTKAAEITIEEIKKLKDIDMFEKIEKFQNESKAKVWLIQSYSSDQKSLLSSDNNLQYSVSSVCWNCSASVLAVAYKVSEHIDWCTHESYALLWNQFKTSKSEEPSAVFDTDSCVSTLISHPTQPSIYCSGALNGKISVWNTRNSENEIQIGSAMAHQSCVSALHWTQANRFGSDLGLIISSGLDSKVLVWKLQDKALVLKEVFVVLAQEMPRTIQIKGNKSETGVGILSMSFNCEDPNIFIIGCIGGAIFQCSLLCKKPVLSKLESTSKHNSTGIEPKSPVVMAYACHRSHVNVVQFSPLSRNIFFSCSSDSELRIYNILQTVPILVVHTDVPLLSAEWSPSRPDIAAVGANGKVYIYSITDSNVSNASFSFSIGDQIYAKSLIYSKNENIERIAVIASNDEIQVWDLTLTSDTHSDRKYTTDVLKRMTAQEDEL